MKLGFLQSPSRNDALVLLLIPKSRDSMNTWYRYFHHVSYVPCPAHTFASGAALSRLLEAVVKCPPCSRRWVFWSDILPLVLFAWLWVSMARQSTRIPRMAKTSTGTTLEGSNSPGGHIDLRWRRGTEDRQSPLRFLTICRISRRIGFLRPRD